MLAVDCHPWDGILELSLLTLKEVQEDKLLFDVEEMAAWTFFQFSKSLSSWEPSIKLAKEMQSSYSNASDKKTLAKEAFILCAKAMRSPSVEQALSDLKKSSDFKISVANPDTGEEYLGGFCKLEDSAC